jgi:hypothetical protein
MKKVMCSSLTMLAVILIFAMASGAAFAQSSTDLFSVNYFSNNTVAGAPAATLRFTNHGEQQAESSRLSSGAVDQCAMIYVYAADQQLTECCGCHVTTNGLQTINVKTQLLANTLTRVVPNNGTIEIVSGLPTSGGIVGPKGNNDPACDPTNVNLAPEIDSWLTHIQNKVGTAFPITETRGDEEFLSSTELSNLEGDCAFAERLGSGFGVCDCGPFEQ